MMNHGKICPDFENLILGSNVNDLMLSSVIYFGKTLAPSTLLQLSCHDNLRVRTSL